MNILVISDNYPSDRMPNTGAFVYNLVQELSRYHDITVLAPFKRQDLLKPKKAGYGREYCRVLRPLYFSYSNKQVLGLDTGKWSGSSKARVVNACLKKLPQKPDVIYAHFLRNALSVLNYIRKYRIPLVIASGESSYAIVAQKPEHLLRDLEGATKHFICVSATNRTGLLKLGFDKNKMTIIPNAVNYEIFQPLDKSLCKEKLGISKDKFVVGFVGHFIHRKGPNRIVDAIKKLADKSIQLVCVGGKGQIQANDFTKIIPPVANYQLPEIYNAFDVFVLPTLSEGHCNVIEEAKACGIPVISSKGTSVEEQLDDTMGILIDPLDIQELATAIKNLKDNKGLRQSMETVLKRQRGIHSLRNRAKKINALLLDAIGRNSVERNYN